MIMRYDLFLKSILWGVLAMLVGLVGASVPEGMQYYLTNHHYVEIILPTLMAGVVTALLRWRQVSPRIVGLHRLEILRLHFIFMAIIVWMFLFVVHLGSMTGNGEKFIHRFIRAVCGATFTTCISASAYIADCATVSRKTK